MKKLSLMHFLLLAGGIIGLGFLAIPAQAQDAQKVQELQHVIDAQQRQLENQQQQLDAQRQLLQNLQKQMESLAKDKDTKGTVVAEKPPAEQPMDFTKVPPPKKVALSQMDKYDREHPSGTNVRIGDHSKTIPIPATKTEIGVHGFAELQIIHDTNGIDDNQFDTVNIPVDGSPSQTKFSVNPSRLEVSSKTPTSVGRVNTFISVDFNGESNAADLQLRQAYGELSNENLGASLLAGQAWTTMADLKAIPETLDIAGPTGHFKERQPLLRVTKSLADALTAEVALETPENVAYVDADKLTRWPDLAVTGTWHADGKYLKHLRLAGLARDLRAEGTNGSTDSAFGWAIGGSGKLVLPFLGAKDNFKFGVQYGDGYGAQIRGGPDDAAFNTVSSELKTIGVFSTYGGWQHWWLNSLRSNLVYGYVNADNPGFVDGDELDNTGYAAVDLIWNPYTMVNFGVEYLWGRRENKDGADGTDNRLLFSSRFEF
jgi:hypothetical protein